MLFPQADDSLFSKLQQFRVCPEFYFPLGHRGLGSVHVHGLPGICRQLDPSLASPTWMGREFIKNPWDCVIS